MKEDVVAVAAKRTPIGRFGGTLRDVAAYDLGATAIRATLSESGLSPAEIDKVIFANCRQAGNGPNPARTASVRGGISVSTPVMTINMACPSGMETVILAARELKTAASTVILCGGMESMSTMPYLLKGARWRGFKAGDKILEDGWSDSIDPICGYGMGMTAENQSEKYGITRQQQDEFALMSQQRAAAAQQTGRFAAEISPYQIDSVNRDAKAAIFAQDEGWRADTTLEKLSKLQPVFKRGGTVTAGNACWMGDAACAVLLTTRGNAESKGLKPLFSVISFAETAVEPSLMGDGPAAAIPLALSAAGMKLTDMDFIEVNEAFAAQVLANERSLNWNREKVNVWGGAIAIGHPTGFTGARLLITLASILRYHNKELGIASLCGGGGVTTAMVIRCE